MFKHSLGGHAIKAGITKRQEVPVSQNIGRGRRINIAANESRITRIAKRTVGADAGPADNEYRWPAIGCMPNALEECGGPTIDRRLSAGNVAPHIREPPPDRTTTPNSRAPRNGHQGIFRDNTTIKIDQGRDALDKRKSRLGSAAGCVAAINPNCCGQEIGSACGADQEIGEFSITRGWCSLFCHLHRRRIVSSARIGDIAVPILSAPPR